MIVSIGEILVDQFIEQEHKVNHPGGAPFNVACNIDQLGGNVYFYGAIGNDDNGKFLLDYLKTKQFNHRIDVLNDRNTTLAIVSLKNGERSFRFERDNGADYVLNDNIIEDLDSSQKTIIHLGSLMLSTKEGKEFFYRVIKKIKQNKNYLISFDVNYRNDIFPNEEEAKAVFLQAIQETDILKFTYEELCLLSNENNIIDALDKITNAKQIVVVSLGKDGSLFSYKHHVIKVDTKEVESIDTTGAGDAFYSSFLYYLDQGLDLNNDDEVRKVLQISNFVGGCATLKKGAIGLIPSKEEINEFIKNN